MQNRHARYMNKITKLLRLSACTASLVMIGSGMIGSNRVSGDDSNESESRPRPKEVRVLAPPATLPADTELNGQPIQASNESAPPAVEATNTSSTQSQTRFQLSDRNSNADSTQSDRLTFSIGDQTATDSNLVQPIGTNASVAPPAAIVGPPVNQTTISDRTLVAERSLVEPADISPAIAPRTTGSDAERFTDPNRFRVAEAESTIERLPVVENNSTGPVQYAIHDRGSDGRTQDASMASALVPSEAIPSSTNDLSAIIRHVNQTPVRLTRLPAPNANASSAIVQSATLEPVGSDTYVNVSSSQDQTEIEELVLRDIDDISFDMLEYREPDENYNGEIAPRRPYDDAFGIPDQTPITQNEIRSGAIYGDESLWLERYVLWEAPAFFHRPLYFEEVNLERYGHHIPVAQPAISGLHFYGNFLMLPYQVLVQRPCDPIYTLGHHRPGSCNPHQIHYFPIGR